MSKAAELASLIGNINAGGGGVNRNLVINGAMNVAQRGTSATDKTTTGYFTVDRWQFVHSNSDSTVTVTQDSSAPAGFSNSTKLDCTAVDTSASSNGLIKFRQKIEGQNLQQFSKGTSSAKPFAVSFYVKGNANATYGCELLDANNTRQITKLFNVTTGWTRVELTFPADTTGTFNNDNAQGMQIQFILHAGSAYTTGTLNSNAWAVTSATTRYGGISSFVDNTARTFFITGIQLEVGQNPTEFEHEPFEKTLAKCQRYFYRWNSDVGYSFFAPGYCYSVTGVNIMGQMPVPMRSAQTFSYNGNWRICSDSCINVTNLALDKAQDDTPNISVTTGGGNTTGNCYGLGDNNDTSAYLQFDSEL